MTLHLAWQNYFPFFGSYIKILLENCLDLADGNNFSLKIFMQPLYACLHKEVLRKVLSLVVFEANGDEQEWIQNYSPVALDSLSSPEGAQDLQAKRMDLCQFRYWPAMWTAPQCLYLWGGNCHFYPISINVMRTKCIRQCFTKLYTIFGVPLFGFLSESEKYMLSQHFSHTHPKVRVSILKSLILFIGARGGGDDLKPLHHRLITFASDKSKIFNHSTNYRAPALG